MRSVITLLITLLFLAGAQAQTGSGKTTDKKRAQSSSKQVSKADINTGSQSELEAVKGIGPATAKKIIANRPYTSLDDLKKAGFTPARIDNMRDSLTISTSTSAAASDNSSKSTGTKKPSLWERLKGKKSSDSAQSSSTASPSSPQNTATTSSTATMTQAPGGGNGKVWVNTNTKVFHREGDQWYGKTKKGEYMTEQAALAAGYRPAKEHK